LFAQLERLPLAPAFFLCISTRCRNKNHIHLFIAARSFVKTVYPTKGMYIPITIAALASLTAAMILLRIFWLRLPSRLRFFLIRASIALIALHVLFVLTKWSTTSDRLNTVINWLAIASYALLVLLFSRLSPRWLTVPSSIILL